MKFKLVYQVALSLLIARWKQTLVAAIGVTISITMFITVLSFMSGLNDMLDGLITNRTAHIRIYKEIKISETQPADYVNSKGHNFVSSIKPKNELLCYMMLKLRFPALHIINVYYYVLSISYPWMLHAT